MMIQVMERAGEAVRRASVFLNTKIFVLGVASIGLMVIPTTIDVVGGLFRHSLSSAQEIVEFLQVVLVFSCLGYIQDKREHIYVEMFFEKFPEAIRNALRVALFGATTVVFALVSWRLCLLGFDKMHAMEVSMILEIPIYLCIFFAAAGCATGVLSLFSTTLDALTALLKDGRGVTVLMSLALLAVLLSSPWWLGEFPWATNKGMLGAACMASLLGLLLLGLPIAFSMMLVGFVGMLLVYPTSTPALSMLGSNSYTTAANYMYSVVPMFILMGEFATIAGISRELFATASVWLGHAPGGLAVATVGGCAGFAAVSGDSMATAVTMASVALPEMERAHYDSGFACATLAAGGTLGILIPPSTGFIFYALVTEESIGKLFMAGIIPGFVLAGIFSGIVMLYAIRNPGKAPRGPKTTMVEKFASLSGVISMIGLIALVLGGILAGIFSPTQGGAVGAAGTLLYALVRRRMTWASFITALTSSALVTGKLLMILVAVGLLGNFFAVTRVPFELADMVIGLGAHKYVVFSGIVVMFIVLGCMINVIPMILLTLPALYPTVLALGFDPIWFGVVTVILMEMGQITPPVGINVYAMSSVATHVPMASVFRHIIPYFLGMLLMVGVLLVFPELATWLPGILFD